MQVMPDRAFEIPDSAQGFVSLPALERVFDTLDADVHLKGELQGARQLRDQVSEGWGEAEILQRASAVEDVLKQSEYRVDSTVRRRLEYVVAVLRLMPTLLNCFRPLQLGSVLPAAEEFPQTFLQASREVNALGIVEAVLHLARSFPDINSDLSEIVLIEQIRSALKASPAALRNAVELRALKSKFPQDQAARSVSEILLLFSDRWQDLERGSKK